MTDRHGIGRKMEQEAMHYCWKWKGWKAFWQPPRGKFVAQDIWGVFDFICLSQEGEVVGIQVCQDRPCWVDSRKAAINQFMVDENPRMQGFVLAYKRNKDGTVIWRTI